MEYKDEFLVRNLYYFENKHKRIFIGEKIDEDTVYIMSKDKYINIYFTKPLVNYNGIMDLLVLNFDKRVSRLPYCRFDETVTLNEIKYYERELSYYNSTNKDREI